MSFSISTQKPTKVEALADIAEKMVIIVEQQPIHARDHDVVNAITTIYADLVEEDEAKDMVITVSGSLGWEERASYVSGDDPVEGEGEADTSASDSDEGEAEKEKPTIKITAANINCSAYLVVR